MNKLYNIYKQLILEGVNIKQVQDVINNNKAVNLSYNHGRKDGDGGTRYCQVLAMGKTDKGNNAIRIYQISGPNVFKDKYGKENRWKTLLIDKIENWTVTNFTFYAPPDELFNALGDKTLNIPDSNGVSNMAIFGGKNLDKYRERHANWQSDIKTKQANEPLVKDRKGNEPEPNVKPNRGVEPDNLNQNDREVDFDNNSDEELEDNETL